MVQNDELSALRRRINKMAVALAFGSLALVLYGTSSICTKKNDNDTLDSYMRDEYRMESHI